MSFTKQFIQWPLQTGIKWLGKYVPSSLPPKIAVYLHEVSPVNLPRLVEMIRYIRKEGYRFVDVNAYLDPNEAKVAWLSFDDSYANWVEISPVLLDLGVEATFFVNTCAFRDVASQAEISAYLARLAYWGEPQPLTMATHELKRLAADGHTIGCHSDGHYDLTDLDFDAACNDILLNRQRLTEVVGHQPSYLAYPYGMPRHFSPRLARWCEEHGFRRVFSATPGLLHRGTDAFVVPRTPWRFERGIQKNISDLGVDGRLFTKLTGRSVIG